MAAAGKKKNKSKTLSLTEFLGDKNVPTFAPSAKTSWADQVEEQDNEGADVTDYGGSVGKKIDIAALPTAPRSVRGANVDLSKVPSKPPFKAFLGNLSYDVSVNDIEKFFRSLKVVSVDLPQSQDGRMKGFGYAEFEDRQALIDALSMNDGLLKNRNIRIDLADRTQGGRDEMGREGHGGRKQQTDDEDKTTGDWRRKEDRPHDDSADDHHRASGDDSSGYNRDRYGDRRSAYGDRSSRSHDGPHDDNAPWVHDRRVDAQEFSRNGDRGGQSSRFASRDFRYENQDRSYSSKQDRSFGDRQERSFAERQERSYKDRQDRSYGDRSYGDRQDRSYGDRQDRSYDDRSFGNKYQNGRSDRDRGSDRDFRPRDYSGDRDGERRDRPPRDSENPDEAKEPKERRRLQLQPRSKPVDEIGKSEKKSAIFGEAKPVDTSSREKEIEERLKKEVVEPEVDDNELNSRPSRSSVSEAEKGEKSGRVRLESSNSTEGSGKSSGRERVTSTSSSKSSKSTTATTAPASSSSKSTSDTYPTSSNETSKAPSSKQSTSDVSQASPPPVKYVDAPPPKENAWSKRKTEVDVSKSSSEISVSSSDSGVKNEPTGMSASASVPPANAPAQSAIPTAAPVRRAEVHIVHDGDELSELKAANVWEKRRLDQQQKEKEGKENDRREKSSEEKDVEKQSEKTDKNSVSVRSTAEVVSSARSERSSAPRPNDRYESSGRGKSNETSQRGGGSRVGQRGGGPGRYSDRPRDNRDDASRRGGHKAENFDGRHGDNVESGKREKTARSVDDMPKLESHSAKDWSDRNKYSMLLGDDEDDQQNGEDSDEEQRSSNRNETDANTE